MERIKLKTDLVGKSLDSALPTSGYDPGDCSSVTFSLNSQNN